MKVYHYAKVDDLLSIFGRTRAPGGKSGLTLGRSVGREYEPAFQTKAVYALLEPAPKEWVDSEGFEETWGTLASDLGMAVLLEIDVPEGAGAFVIDRGHMEGFLGRGTEGKVPGKHIFPDRAEAEKAYLESKVPLKEFLARRDELHFSLPEVILTDSVELERVRISESQPLLERGLRLRLKDPIDYHWAVRIIDQFPELKQWHQGFVERENIVEPKRESEPTSESLPKYR